MEAEKGNFSPYRSVKKIFGLIKDRLTDSNSRTAQVFALSLGRGLTSVVLLLAGMVMARILTKGELATYRQTLLAYDFAAPILSLGLSSALYYFLPTEKKRSRGVVADGLIIMLAMGILYSLFIALHGNQLLAKRFSNPEIIPLLLFFIPFPLITLPAGLTSAVLIIRGRIIQLSSYDVISHLIMAISIIGACLLWKTPKSMVIIRVIVAWITGMAGIYLMIRALPRDEWKPRWDSMKTLVKFSIPLSLASMLGTISLQFDKLIVSFMCTPEEFAVYSIGAIEIPLIGIVTSSISVVILPSLRTLVSSGKNTEALTLFRQTAEKAAWILLPFMLFLMISASPLIRIMFSEKYSDSVLPFRIYLLFLPIRIAVYGSILLAYGQTRAILYRTICGLIINIVLSIVLIKWMGYVGAAWATIIMMYGWELPVNLLLISKITKTSFLKILPFKSLGTILLYFIMPTLLCALVNYVFYLSEWMQLIINTIIFIGFAGYISKRKFNEIYGFFLPQS